MEKTRNLSVAEYFAVIQREYLIAEFRKKIYYNPRDKNYYQRVMNHKGDKINDISRRNHLDSIFTSSKKMEEVRNELFDSLGNPTFELNNTDVENYYCVGNDFSYNGEAWILEEVCGDTLVIRLSSSGERKEVRKDQVCRIL